MSGINSYTDEAKVWNRLRRIKGQNIGSLPVANDQGKSWEDQANAIGAHFQHISSSAHYSKEFLRYK